MVTFRLLMSLKRFERYCQVEEISLARPQGAGIVRIFPVLAIYNRVSREDSAPPESQRSLVRYRCRRRLLTGLRENLMRRVVKPVAKRLGMPWLSWHVFRHTHATLGEQIGMSLSDRQAQIGHGTVEMTLHYTHSDLERRRAGVETISDQLIGEAAGRIEQV